MLARAGIHCKFIATLSTTRLDERHEVRVVSLTVFNNDALTLQADDDDAAVVVFGEGGAAEAEG